LVGKRILGYIKLGVKLEVVELEVKVVNNFNLLKLVELGDLPRTRSSLGG